MSYQSLECQRIAEDGKDIKECYALKSCVKSRLEELES